MKKYALLALMLITSCRASAEGELMSLKVDSDIVYFSTNKVKTEISPSCMTAENVDKWAVSLTTATGKAMYALLVGAYTNNRQISVESANDCNDAPTFERAKSVEVLAFANKLSSHAKSFYLHSGDGEELGPIYNFDDNGYRIYYYNKKGLPVDFFLKNDRMAVYFKQTDCKGEPYITAPATANRFPNNPGFQNGKYLDTLDRETTRTKFLSRIRNDNDFSCVNKHVYYNEYYSIDTSYPKNNHPICGTHICKVVHK